MTDILYADTPPAEGTTNLDLRGKLAGRTIQSVRTVRDEAGDEWTVLDMQDGQRVEILNETSWVFIDLDVM